MIKTLTPFSSTEKTAEIMSRYRPIAPKPEPASPFPSPPKINRRSTFLTNVWPQLQSRPARARKRARAALVSPVHNSLKRPRIRFGDSGVVGSDLVTLPLLPFVGSDETRGGSEVHFMKFCEIPEEKDLLKQFRGSVATCGGGGGGVITPHPVRPVGSSIRVGCIQEALRAGCVQAAKKKEEVEREVESEVLPAVISDSNNIVRMANSAYKEMIGQPECLWLDSMVSGDERRRKTKGRRICGEVMLDLSDAAAAVPNSCNGFTCWARIDWGNGNGNEGKNNSVTAFCDVIKLCCVSTDYLFTWRFHTRTRGNENDASNPICISV